MFNSPKSDDGRDQNDADEEGSEGETALKGTLLAGVLLVGFVGGFVAGGYVYKEQINSFLSQFSTFIEGIVFNDSYAFLRLFFFFEWLLGIRNSLDPILRKVKGFQCLYMRIEIDWWEI